MQNMQSTNGFLINIKFEVTCFDSVPFLDTALRLDDALKTKVNVSISIFIILNKLFTVLWYISKNHLIFSRAYKNKGRFIVSVL